MFCFLREQRSFLVEIIDNVASDGREKELLYKRGVVTWKRFVE